MDVGGVASKLGIHDRAVIAKGKELVRLSSIKVPGGLGQGEVCKAAACLELACSTCTHVQAPSRDDFVRQGCTTKKVYVHTYTMLQKALGVTPSLGIPQLAVRFGCEPLAKPAEALLGLYRARFLMRANSQQLPPANSRQSAADHAQQAALPRGSLDGSKQQAHKVHADFSHPVFALAALHLTAQRAAQVAAKSGGKKRQVAKFVLAKAAKALDISSAQLQHTLESMQALCAAELGLDDPSSDTDHEGPASGEGADKGEHSPQGRGAAAGKVRPRQRKRKAACGEGLEEVWATDAGCVDLGEEEDEQGQAPAKRARKQPAAAASRKRGAARHRGRKQQVADSDEEADGDNNNGELPGADEWQVVARAGQD